MAFIGNTPTTQAFTPAVDIFSGNGSTTAFTLSRPVASVAQVQAFIENVPQSPVDAFTVNGNTITFTSAPPSGSSNIYVRYTSPIIQVIAPSDGSVGTSALAAGAVTTAKLADANVTRAKASDGVVGGWKGLLYVNTNTTITAADAGKYISISSGSLSVQINTTGLNAGDRFHFNGNGGSCTLTLSAGSFVAYGITTVSSLVITNGNGMSLFWDGSNLIVENSSLNLEALTWTDVTASRAFGTTYTNTTGKPITVSVWAYSGATNGNKQVSIVVGGVQVATNGQYGTTGNAYPSCSAIIPSGATYSADTNGSNVSISLSGWRELR